ncbi:MAG: hypothetical protein RLZZ528_659, partial [Pseudomonadota bacterium]
MLWLGEIQLFDYSLQQWWTFLSPFISAVFGAWLIYF